jgi:HK97 gp10 family phage protein
MSDAVTWKINGLSQLQKQLEEAQPKIARKVLRDGLDAGAEIMLNAVVEHAPEDTGFLKKHFNKKGRVKRRGISGSVLIGPDGKIDYPTASGIMRFMVRHGKPFLGGRISVLSVVRFLQFGTSRMSPKPFLTQAFDSKVHAATDAIVEKIEEGIQEVKR